MMGSDLQNHDEIFNALVSSTLFSIKWSSESSCNIHTFVMCSTPWMSKPSAEVALYNPPLVASVPKQNSFIMGEQFQHFPPRSGCRCATDICIIGRDSRHHPSLGCFSFLLFVPPLPLPWLLPVVHFHLQCICLIQGVASIRRCHSCSSWVSPFGRLMYIRPT